MGSLKIRIMVFRGVEIWLVFFLLPGLGSLFGREACRLHVRFKV